MHLYEAHLPVANTEAAQQFYVNVVGLPFAYRDPARDIVFLWATSKDQGMIGLWGPSTIRGPHGDGAKHHIAFAVPFDDLWKAIERFRQKGIGTLGFHGNKINEPNVIGWTPSAQIYFHDPDGHLLEFIAILPEQPRPDFIGSYSEWKSLSAG
jgi:lactoylglutathione lyase